MVFSRKAAKPQTANSMIYRLLLSEYFILYLSLFFFLILWPFVPSIATFRNLANIFSNVWPLLALAIGQMFVLILGGIDLSQTSVMAMASVCGALLMTTELDPTLYAGNPLWGIVLFPDGGLLAGSGWAVPLSVLAMLFIGSLIGLLNGMAVARFKMPPFMVTLVSMMFFSGLAVYVTQSENIIHLPAAYIAIGKGGFGFISFAFCAVGLLAVASHFLLTRTVFGAWLYATGKNLRASVISGVPTEKMTLAAYTVSGFCAAVASVLYSARLEGGRPTLGQNQLLDVIGAAVIGGISLFGGKGKVMWALFGVLFFVLLSNALNLLNLSYFTINMVKGCVIIIAALLDVLRARLAAHGKRV